MQPPEMYHHPCHPDYSCETITRGLEHQSIDALPVSDKVFETISE